MLQLFVIDANSADAVISEITCKDKIVKVKLSDQKTLNFSITKPIKKGHCESAKMSPDKKSAGWIVEATSPSYSRKFYIFHSNNSSPFQVGGDEGFVWQWSFKNNNEVLFEAGGGHGNQGHFRYDIDRRKMIKSCFDEEPNCPASVENAAPPNHNE